MAKEYKVKKLSGSILTASYDYTYPKDLDLKPGSVLHERIRAKIIDYARASRTVMEKRYPYWRKIEESLTAYIDLTDEEEKVKEENDRKSVSIVIPAMYAILETLLTYDMAALMQSPMFRYRGVGPEDTVKALLLEQVIELQVQRNDTALAVYVMLRDNRTYGFGVVTPVWEVCDTSRKESVSREVLGPFGEPLGTQTRKRTRSIKSEGNKLYNVDPYYYFPDVSVPIHMTQSGQFQGWMKPTNKLNMLEEERYDDNLFNCRYLRHTSDRSQFALEQDTLATRSAWQFSEYDRQLAVEKDLCDVIYMYAKVIPEEWGLGDGEYPEKWLFALGNDEVVIKAQPLNLDHDQFPIVVCASDFDGYSPSPVSRLEIIYGLQEKVDWLLNTRQANVRKCINNVTVVDPSIINFNDVKKSREGGIWRLNREAFGRPGAVKDGAAQLAMQDVTAGFIQDVMTTIELMKEISGAVDSLQGLMKYTGERVTATQVKGTRSSAMSKLEKSSRLSGIMGIKGIGTQLAYNTQQLMSTNVFIEVFGDLERRLSMDAGIMAGMIPGAGGRQSLEVTPDMILCGIDVIPQDGSVPASEYADTWVQMYQVLAGNPLLAQRFDMMRIFKHIARMLGAKNIDDFELPMSMQIQMQMMGQSGIEEGKQNGNLVPIGGAGGGY